MTVGMWFTDDLANILRGISLAALPVGDSEYQAGFQAALIALSLALGIPVEGPILPRRNSDKTLVMSRRKTT